jgi:N-carbamoyl-L-amino-acid hydrolase
MPINADRLIAELHTLAAITDAEPSANGTAVTRIVFTPRDLEARAWLRSLAEEAGLTVRVDSVGNTFFRLEGADPALPAVATGSHIDAIPHAGMYDGTVGVLGGLEALRAIAHSGTRPRRSVELILFTSEEPTRFGIGCLGSRLLSGTMSDVQAAALRDADGQSLDEVRASAGFPGELADVALAPAAYHAFVELHIEQGPRLERAGLPLGIVTHIAAPAGYRFEIEGLGGHAGALLMPDRRDALCTAAELILSIERHALATGAIDTVATVGTCAVHPGAVNSVPSRVRLELDIRDTEPARRESVMQGVRSDIADIAQRRGVSIVETLVNADEPATCSPHIVAALDEACRVLGHQAMHMVSRAYHDTLFMSRLAPVAMLFIPCRGGVSHRPDEYAAPEDIVRGTEVLAHTLAMLAEE